MNKIFKALQYLNVFLMAYTALFLAWLLIITQFSKWFEFPVGISFWVAILLSGYAMQYIQWQSIKRVILWNGVFLSASSTLAMLMVVFSL